MKFGANTLIWAETFGPEHFPLLPVLKQKGFDGVEFAIFSPQTFPAADVRRELDRANLECTVCSIVLPGMSLISEDAAQRQKGREHITTSIHNAAELGATVIAGPMYSPVGYLTGRRRTNDEWKRAVESWQMLGETARNAGVHVALESLNRFETYFLNTAEDAVALCDEIANPNVGILLDTFHANIEEKHIGNAVRTCARHLKHLHTCENDRGTPGTGHIDWPSFFQAVQQVGYDGWMTIESFGFSLGTVSAAAAIWRDLAATPDAIAFDGVQFLRNNALTKATHAESISPR